MKCLEEFNETEILKNYKLYNKDMEASGDYQRHIVETLMPQGDPLDMARFLESAPA